MKVGAFSISLNVADIHKSKAFYEKLGFEEFGGDIEQNWLIMKNGDAVIGLFQGMFPKNLITFNPGWDQKSQELETFDDVREIQENIKSKDIKLDSEVEEDEGPGSFMITDPDGNQILFDQHL